MRRRRRGFALADFLAGTIMFSATVGVFAGLTRMKLEVLSAAEQRLRALSHAEAAVDRIHRDGLKVLPKNIDADASGFYQVGTFEVQSKLLRAPTGVVHARALDMEGKVDAHGLLEVRVTVRWEEAKGFNEVSLSTVTPQPLQRGGE